MFSSCCACVPPKSNFAIVAGFPQTPAGAGISECECCGLGAGGLFPPYGNCSGCNTCGHGDTLNSKIACEVPWLKPMPIACGEEVSSTVAWNFPLDDSELDGNATAEKRLPGRYPWTVQCVKVCGESSIAWHGPVASPAEAYTIFLCVRVPVEIVVTDGCGYTYCLHSFYTQQVQIELCRKAGLLGNDVQAYIKVSVRIGTPLAPIQQDNALTAAGSNAYCDGFTVPGGTAHWLPTISLDSHISVCLTKMVPYGVICG